MDFERLFAVADQARRPGRLSADDANFVCETVPAALADFPKVTPPKSVRHPGGFTVNGAPVGTFMRSALLLAGQKALGKGFGGDPFYERVESDLALRIMRSHFHGGAPKGAFCCKRCTLAILPVLEADAIRWFDGPPLAKDVRRMIDAGEWRFASPPAEAMRQWALA
jgi:hypothetical protein